MESQLGRTLVVRITSPEGTIYEHNAKACRVRAVDGGLTVMPNHTPILVPLVISVVEVTRTQDGTEHDFIAINGGVLEMVHNQCEIITNYAIRARDIDEARVQVEQQQAEEAMQDALAKHDKRAFKKAKIELDRALNMMAARRHRRR